MLLLTIVSILSLVIGAVWRHNDIVLPVVISLYLGFLLNLVANSVSRSRLSLVALEDSKNGPGNIGHKFLHIQVLNQPRMEWLSWLMQPQSSLLTKAKVTFYNSEGNVEVFAVSGRWSSQPEPITFMPDPSGWSGGNASPIFDPTKVPTLAFENILPGDHANLAVAVKFDNESEFYGFSDEAYAYGGKHPDHQLDVKSVRIKVELISSNGMSAKKWFTLSNPNKKLSSFKIVS